MDILSLLTWLPALIGGLVLLFLVWVFLKTISKWIVKVPPTEALVVFGPGKKSELPIVKRVLDPDALEGVVKYKNIEVREKVNYQIVKGGWTIVIPSIHTTKTLHTDVMTIDVKVSNVLSNQAVPISVDGTAQIQIGGDEVHLATAAEKLLGKSREDVMHVATFTLQGHLRAIIGLMTVTAVYKDREAFSQQVQDVAVEDMAGLGFIIGSFVINDIDDDQGYITALGAREIQEKLRDERIVKAQADLAAKTEELERDLKVHEKTEATNLREVQKDQAVALANQKKNMMVAEQEALAVEMQKRTEQIVPAEAEAKAMEISAHGYKMKKEIEADADAQAIKLQASGTAQATRETKMAEADGEKAVLFAKADGTRAQLLAEAEGKLKVAEASAAEDQINVRQFLGELIIQGEVSKAQALAEAIGRIGENVKIVQFAGGNGGEQKNSLMSLLGNVPEFAAMFNAKTEALTGTNIDGLLAKVMKLLKTGEVDETEVTSNDVEPEKKVEDNTPGVGKLSDTPVVDVEPVKKVKPSGSKKRS